MTLSLSLIGGMWSTLGIEPGKTSQKESILFFFHRQLTKPQAPLILTLTLTSRKGGNHFHVTIRYGDEKGVSEILEPLEDRGDGSYHGLFIPRKSGVYVAYASLRDERLETRGFEVVSHLNVNLS